MRVVLSVLFWTYLGVSSVVLWFVACALWAVGLVTDRPRQRLLHLFTCWWAIHYVHVWPWWSVRYEGRDRIPTGAAVLVSNHQSMADILVLYGLRRHFKWVSKDSVFKVPFIGWNMRLNDYVRLSRGSNASAVTMMKACRDHLRRGNPLMIFPEGTRSKDGRVRPFKPGAFELAVRGEVPVVPIVVHDTATVLPKRGWVLRGGHVRAYVEVLEPVPPDATGGDVAALAELVRDRISTRLDELRANGP